jgi:hypothetical protein
MKISEICKFLALIYSNISQIKTLEPSITSVLKVMAPRNDAIFAAWPLYCTASAESGWGLGFDYIISLFTFENSIVLPLITINFYIITSFPYINNN